MNKKMLFTCFMILAGLILTAAFDTPEELTILTYGSFAASDELIQQFESENNVKLNFIEAGNAGEVISRAVLTRDEPIADVIIGFDDSQLKKIADYDLLEPYTPAEKENIPEQYWVSQAEGVVPFNYGDICINYDRAWFEKENLAVPQSLNDLAKPEYQNLLVTQDPGASNTGMGFLLATIAQYGEDGYIDYWKSLVENGLQIGSSWTSTYYTNFTAAAGSGEQPMVVSYATSPAAEAIYSESGDAPTASLVDEGMCYRMVEYCGILKGSDHTELAKKFIDAFISKEWQEDLPMQMFVYPVNSQAELPEAFALYGQPAQNPVQLDSAYVAENKTEWIRAWSEEVLSAY